MRAEGEADIPAAGSGRQLPTEVSAPDPGGEVMGRVPEPVGAELWQRDKSCILIPVAPLSAGVRGSAARPEAA